MSAIPNLWGVITPQDVSQKGGGNYAADYVNWALTMSLMHKHAPGWTFELRTFGPENAQQQSVHRAPDGSAYLVGRWVNLENGMITPDFPQSIMDNRNRPIPADAVSSRDLTDAHRRCICTSAAFSFGLAAELWARVAVEDPHREEKQEPAKEAPVTPLFGPLMVSAFAEMNVSVEDILAWGKVEALEGLSAKQIGELRGFYRQWRDEDLNPRVAMGLEDLSPTALDDEPFNMGDDDDADD